MDYSAHGILQAWILEWVAFPFSRESFQPRDQTQVSCILQVDSLPTELSEKPQMLWKQGYSYFIHCIPMYSHGSCANTPSVFLKEQFPYVSMIHLKKDSEASFIISIALPSKHVPQLCFLAYLVLLIPKAVRRKVQDSTM